jgi:hypothetical protein
LSRWILYFCCPAGTRDRRSLSIRTCDQVRKWCPLYARTHTFILYPLVDRKSIEGRSPVELEDEGND